MLSRVTSASLLVAFLVLVLVEVSYRRWTRRSTARRMRIFVDLEEPGAEVIRLPERDPDAATHHIERRSS
jgi:hypothetical protein